MTESWQAQREALGAFIRTQRQMANLSLRQLAELTSLSNPYLSQVERGQRNPSAEILQQIAKGLRISAEALYVRAGILEDRPADSGVRSALLADPELTERQTQVLLEIYESFRKENAALAAEEAANEAGQGQGQGQGGEALAAEAIQDGQDPAERDAEPSADG